MSWEDKTWWGRTMTLDVTPDVTPTPAVTQPNSTTHKKDNKKHARKNSSGGVRTNIFLGSIRGPNSHTQFEDPNLKTNEATLNLLLHTEHHPQNSHPNKKRVQVKIFKLEIPPFVVGSSSPGPVFRSSALWWRRSQARRWPAR